VTFLAFEALEGDGVAGVELDRGAVGALVIPIDAANLGSDRDNLDRTRSPVEPDGEVIQLLRLLVAVVGDAAWVAVLSAPCCPLRPIGAVALAG